jgi:hypothetical protein
MRQIKTLEDHMVSRKTRLDALEANVAELKVLMGSSEGESMGLAIMLRELTI